MAIFNSYVELPPGRYEIKYIWDKAGAGEP